MVKHTDNQCDSSILPLSLSAPLPETKIVPTFFFLSRKVYDEQDGNHQYIYHHQVSFSSLYPVWIHWCYSLLLNACKYS